ncbi:DUF6624 domain-containing protein [Stenotrophomonas sp. PS02297]|uniref:DUF6624 domain-containing protein n=1 Tax=Stenotrophomonas sp. PS02297 TaxID=2991423 RepID=UPI00249A1EC6|nr:DUF6624 domain-containing protein [Stenotrophomonas sp. PS02297]
MKAQWMWGAGMWLALMPTWAQAETPAEPRYVISKALEIDEACLERLVRQYEDGSEPLDTSRLERFKEHLRTCGWPSVPSAGRRGVDAAGSLLLRASADDAFQEQIIDLVQERVGVDLDAFGYAWLNDTIQLQHGRAQQFGACVAVENGRAVLSPKPEKTPRFWRDFMGLSPVEEWLEGLQARLDAGSSLGMAELSPPLAMEAYQPFTQPELRRLIGRMINRDQDARGEAVAAMRQGDEERRKMLDRQIAEIDAENRATLQDIFGKHGFPTPEMIGRDGVSSVFLLVQHADDDPGFQARALELAEPLMQRRGMSRQQYAMLTDRVLLARDQPQRYGSQYKVEQGMVALLPLADPESVDMRRAQMAMGTLASYLDAVAKQLGASVESGGSGN